MKNIFFFVLWVLVIASGVFLGRWQMERLVWKEDLLSQIDRAYQSPLSENMDEAMDLAMRGGFARVRLEVMFDPSSRWFIEPRVHHGIVGAHIYEMAEVEGGESLWVNRGFVPINKVDSIESPDDPVKMTLQIIRPPPSYGRMKDTKGSEDQFLWKNLGSPNVIGIVESENETTNHYPIPVGARPTLPNNHFAYAIFWFGMSVIAALFGAFLIMRKIYWTKAAGASDASDDA